MSGALAMALSRITTALSVRTRLIVLALVPVFGFSAISLAYVSSEKTVEAAFGSVQQFMQGIPTMIQGQRIDSQLSYQQWLMGWFGQYDVRVSSRLTLTVGLRHEFTTAPSERYSRAHSMQTLFDAGPDLNKPLFTPPKAVPGEEMLQLRDIRTTTYPYIAIPL